MEKFVEAADKRLVIQAKPPNHRIQALANLLPVLFLEVVVEKNDHRQRKSFRGKDINFLFDIVFKDAEFVPLQICNEIARAVLHRYRKNNEVGADADLRSRLARGRRGGLRRCLRTSALEGPRRRRGLAARRRCNISKKPAEKAEIHKSAFSEMF